jgi:hypothetical protein
MRKRIFYCFLNDVEQFVNCIEDFFVMRLNFSESLQGIMKFGGGMVRAGMLGRFRNRN